MDESVSSPKPRSLNLLESLMREDETAEQSNDGERVSSCSTPSYSPEYYDTDKQAITRESSAGAFSEFKMNDIVSRSKVVAGNLNAGFRGKKVMRPGSASCVAMKNKPERPFSADKSLRPFSADKSLRPFSADFSRREKIQSGSNLTKRRAKSAKGPRQKQVTFSRGQRRSSVGSSSGTSSSDEEYEYFVPGEQGSDHNDSSESDNEHVQRRQKYSPDVGEHHNDTDSWPSSEEDADHKENDKTSKESEGLGNTPGDTRASRQPEREPRPIRRATEQKHSPGLLSRKKQQNLNLFQRNPEKYFDKKLQKKYSELKDLRACTVVEERSQVIHSHLYQMDLLHDQYQSSSHGHLMSAPIIPQSPPKGARQRTDRPLSTKRPLERQSSAKQESAGHSFENKATEEAEKKTRTDSHLGAQQSGKKKKLEAKLDLKQSDTTVEISESPSTENGAHANYDGHFETPRRNTTLDHHIKYSENECLQKWLKTKNRKYRQNIKEEKKKKKAEREKLINEANEILERKLMSQQLFESWVKAKNRELAQKNKEEKTRQMKLKHGDQNEMTFPGNSVHIKTLHRSVDSEKEMEADQDEWLPPQTKFMYKRPVSGRIKLYYQIKGKLTDTQQPDTCMPVIQVRGKSPIKQQPDPDNKGKEEIETLAKNKSSSAGSNKKKTDDRSNAVRQRKALDIAYVNETVNSSRSHLSDRASQAFSLTNSGTTYERPGTANILEGAYSPEQTNMQTKRPSTAPVSKNRMPLPQRAVQSPRRVIISPRNEEVSTQRFSSSSSELPFPPEKGVPAYVAQKQKKLFGDKMAYNEADQRELLHEVLVKEGVADVDKLYTEQTDQFDTESNDINVKESRMVNTIGHRKEISSESPAFVCETEENFEEKEFEEGVTVDCTKPETGKTKTFEENEGNFDLITFSSPEVSDSDSETDKRELLQEVLVKENIADIEKLNAEHAVKFDTESSDVTLKELVDTTRHSQTEGLSPEWLDFNYAPKIKENVCTKDRIACSLTESSDSESEIDQNDHIKHEEIYEDLKRVVGHAAVGTDKLNTECADKFDTESGNVAAKESVNTIEHRKETSPEMPDINIIKGSVEVSIRSEDVIDLQAPRETSENNHNVGSDLQSKTEYMYFTHEYPSDVPLMQKVPLVSLSNEIKKRNTDNPGHFTKFQSDDKYSCDENLDGLPFLEKVEVMQEQAKVKDLVENRQDVVEEKLQNSKTECLTHEYSSGVPLMQKIPVVSIGTEIKNRNTDNPGLLTKFQTDDKYSCNENLDGLPFLAKVQVLQEQRKLKE